MGSTSTGASEAIPVMKTCSERLARKRPGLRILVLAALPLAMSPGVMGDEPRAWRVGEMETSRRLVVPIPPLAVVTADDASGKTWQQTGTVKGGLEVAKGDFRQVLRAGGWGLDKTIPLGRGRARSELAIWTKPGHRILLMIWEKEPGLCGFSWGEER